MKKKTVKTSKEQLIRELAELRQRVAELEDLEAKSKQATEAILWSETNYKILVDCLREGVFIIQDDPVRLAFANPAAEKITGHSVEELTAFTPEKIEMSIHPEDRTEFIRLLRDRLEGKPVPEQYEVRGIKKDGSSVWATVSSGRIEYQGEPATLAVIRDITDLKRAEKALKKAFDQQERLVEKRTAELSRANEQLRQKHMELSAILDSAPLIMMLVDQDRQVRQVSNALIQFTGRKEEEMLGKRGGEALRCIHHLDDPKGCGYGPICETCSVRRVVLDTFKTGDCYYKVEAKLSFEDDEVEERVLLMSTALLDIPENMVLICIEDITEQKMAEEALIESEERFRSTVEMLPTVIFEYDLNGILTYISPYGYKLLGYDPEDLENDFYVLQIVAPEEHEKHSERLQRLLQGERTPPFEYRLLSKDGSIRWGLIISALIHEDGQAAGVRTAVIDITERKQAEKALWASEKKYRDLYELMRLITDNVPDLIWAKDMDDRYLFANQAVCDKLLMCASPDRAVGKTGMFFAEQERKAGYEQTFGEICVDSDTVTKERKIPSFFLEEGLVRGKYLVLDVHKAPFLNEDGEMIGTVGCGRDITQEKETAKALHESEEKYKTLTENSLTGIFIHQDGKYAFVNDRFADIHGCTPDELLGKDYLPLIHPDEREVAKQRVSKKLKKESVTQHYEVKRLKKDKTTVWCEIMSTGIDYRGRPAVMGNLIDITDRKKAEEFLKISNEKLLIEYNQRKILSKKLIDLLEEDRQQVAMELHDHIGQVLTALKIDIEMTRERFKHLHSDLESRLMAIEARAAQALDDVRDISHGLRPSVLDIMGLGPCLREFFNDIESRFGIEIHFFQDNIPKRFISELELTLFRIAQEALSNIIKHAQASKIFVNLTKKDSNVFFSVEDNGIGFEPDQTIASFSKRKPLGLHIMRERAIQLGGEFSIESHKQGGTHLSVEIPF